MKMELEGAQAAVEECYRRRARRAGLEGVLPAGRPMSEGELDTLSELLGDETGGRAKRRREVEEMTIEEMEAELREVKAKIRKRRRAGTGWLPLTLALLMCLTVSLVEGFTAYDCSNRSNIMEAYSLLEPDAFANMGKEGEIQMYCRRDPSSAVLRHVLGSGSHAVHPVLGAQATGGLGVPAGKEERQDRYQRTNVGGQDWSNRITQHVPGWWAGRRQQVRGIVTLPDGKVLDGQAAQGLYEITLREEFARLN
jgi:hypothetical protein